MPDDVILRWADRPVVWTEDGFATPGGVVVVVRMPENYMTAEKARELAGAILDASVRAERTAKEAERG